jgi:site-specific DNA-methyltransferase (adenine-specific)/adenine-specific DNA-methyltransferase
MPRPQDSEQYELTDAEKRDLIKLTNQGQPIPEKYRFLLFEDKREVELVWNGKTREVCTAILPFQTLEHIDEPRREKQHLDELGLDTRGRQLITERYLRLTITDLKETHAKLHPRERA